MRHKDQKPEIPPTPEVRDRIRQENATKPPSAAYSSDTHDAARDLWISGWNDARIAQALGIPRRETVNEWARRDNWLAIQKDYRRRVLEKTVEVTAQKVAEANVRQLREIEGLKGRVFSELTKNSQVQGRSVEGLVQAAIRLMTLERTILGLDGEASPEAVARGGGFVEEYEKLLECVKEDPQKAAQLVQLQKDRLLLEAQMRELAAMIGPHDEPGPAAP